jgi:ATP-dependent RNA helicase DDX31/DBP7
MKPDVTRQSGVLALVVVPTRELAVQSFEWFLKLCKSFARIVPGMLIGGEKKKSEKARVRKGINILITTPGRLIDHIQHTKCLNLDNVSFLVLDEADRMLELGYERAIQTILAALDEHKKEGSTQRQTLLLSATLTSGIEQLSAVSMKHPVFVDAAVGEEQETNREESLKTLTTPELLKQVCVAYT